MKDRQWLHWITALTTLVSIAATVMLVITPMAAAWAAANSVPGRHPVVQGVLAPAPGWARRGPPSRTLPPMPMPIPVYRNFTDADRPEPLPPMAMAGTGTLAGN